MSNARSADARARSALLVPALALVLLGLSSSAGLAYDSLASRLPRSGSWAAYFGTSEARANVKDGRLLGHGVERTELLQGGHLRVVRDKTYTRVRHPDTGNVVRLRKPWKVHSVLELGPSLRLLRQDTTLSFDAGEDQAIRDEFEQFFEWDHARVVASESGAHLTRTTTLRGAPIERERYEYPGDAIPLEIVGMTLSVAVRRRVERFDFDLLLPGGSTHGIRSQIHRVKSARPFAKGYPVPSERLGHDEALAVVEMRLASPIKYVLFPHKFYMVFSELDPTILRAVWGGDPDENLQAYRLE